MFLTVETSIRIRAPAAAVWDYACRPENWTASNPQEHFGLRFFSSDKLPHEGVEFDQDESVAGYRARLHGRFHYMDRPRLAFWSGIASYRLLGGFVRIRLPEGGVLRIDEEGSTVRLSHHVYIDFPGSVLGRMVRWAFERFLSGRQAVYDHTYRELEFFRSKLESGASFNSES